MAITALPTPPTRSDPDNFAVRADAFMVALLTFTTEANALAAAMNLNATNGTSSTSVAIGTGSKSFTADTGKSWQPGMYLLIADTAAPSTNSMMGQVTSYNSGSGALVVNVVNVVGSGTKTAWIISQSALLSTSVGYLHVRDEKASGTDGGSSSSGVNVRVLNTVVENTITGASLASNLITLPAGTYRIRASAPALLSGKTRAVLYNNTDSSVILLGTNENSDNALTGGVVSQSVISGKFILAAQKAVKINHFICTGHYWIRSRCF
jgi:hypothetical protein